MRGVEQEEVNAQREVRGVMDLLAGVLDEFDYYLRACVCVSARLCCFNRLFD